MAGPQRAVTDEGRRNLTDLVEAEDVVRVLRASGPELGGEPYELYRRLRAITPALRVEDGTVVVIGYDDCARLVREPKLGHQPPAMFARVGIADWEQPVSLRIPFTSLLRLNPPDHTRLRRLVSSAFTARRVQAMSAAVSSWPVRTKRRAQRLVEELLDELPEHDDFVQGLAFPLPITVIGELLGLPKQDWAQFQSLSRDWSYVFETITPELCSGPTGPPERSPTT